MGTPGSAAPLPAAKPGLIFSEQRPALGIGPLSGARREAPKRVPAAPPASKGDIIMFNRTAAMLAATILAGTTSIAGAQQPASGSAAAMQPGVNVGAQAERGESRFEQRSALRRQLRSEGFQDIRISDAMFAIQARTPDGRSVLMIANPGAGEASGAAQPRRDGGQERLSRSGSASSDVRDARRTASSDRSGADERARTSRDVASSRGGTDGDTRAVPVRLPDGRTVLVLVTPADEEGSSQDARASRGERADSGRRGGEGRDGDRPGTNYYSYNWDHPHDEQRLNRGDGRQAARGDRDVRGSDASDGASAVESAVREQYTGAISSELMSADRARSRLESQGFSNVGNWRREGGAYTGTADWHGEEVDFRFDARRGELVEPSRLGRGQVETILSEAGFSDIGGIQQLGNTFRANASQDGTRYLVRVDAETGEILNRRPMREG